MNQQGAVTPSTGNPPSGRRWLRIALAACIALATLLIGLGIAASVWLPDIARQRGEILLSETLGRDVRIGAIDISPLALRVQVNEITMAQPGQTNPALKIGSVRASLSAASLLHGAVVIQELAVDTPRVWLGRDATGRLSVADIIERLASAPPSAGPPPRLVIRNIRIDQGAITIDDAPGEQVHQLTALQLRIPVISTLPGDASTPIEAELQAQLDQASLRIRARTLTANIAGETSADIELQGFDLRTVAAYARQIPGLAVKGGRLDARLQARSAGAIEGEVRIAALEAGMLTAEGGWQVNVQGLNLNLAEIALPLSAPIAQGQIGKVRLALADDTGVISLRDTSLRDAATLRLSGLKADIDALRLAADSPMQLAIESQVNGPRGRITANGKLSGWSSPDTLSLDMNIDARSIDMVALQGLVAEHLPAAVLTRGAAGFKGQVRVEGVSVQVRGDARLDDVNLLSRLDATEIGRWKSLRLDNLAVQTSPLDIRLPNINIDGLFGRLTLRADGRLNIVAATELAEPPRSLSPSPSPTPSSAAPASTAASTPASTPASAPASASRAMPIVIGEVRVNDANIVFTDQKTQPNFRIALTGVSGKVGPLRPGTPGPIELRGTVDRSAPMQIQGRFDPLGPQLSADLVLIAKGIDMPAMSPYAVRHLAYPIEKGKLSLDLRYRIQDGQINADNRIFLDQLTFGDRVDSPGALSIPLTLAVALLKNRRGEIDIELPISGSLNDPQFSIGGIVFKALVNLLVKAVTAPFALIASLFGGSADLSQITFAPGSGSIGTDANKVLGSIAKAMLDRPGIRLEVTGTASEAEDAPALRKSGLDRRLRAEKLAAMATRGQAAGVLRDVEVSAEEYPVLLAQLYRKEFPTPAQPPQGQKLPGPNSQGKNQTDHASATPSLQEMTSALLAKIPAGEAELLALADQRARAARNWLAQEGIETARIFILTSRLDGKTRQAAMFSLR